MRKESPEHLVWRHGNRVLQVLVDYMENVFCVSMFDHLENTDENLAHIWRVSYAELKHKKSDGVITDWQVECSRTNNPTYNNKDPWQQIFINFDVKLPMTGLDKWSAFCEMRPGKFHHALLGPDEPVDKGHPADDTYSDYDRAMGIIQ